LHTDPYFVFESPKPAQFALMAQLVSVCHQWSMTGTFNKPSAHFKVSGSALSPARNKVSKDDKSYFLKKFH